ncbi:hypothetical protein [Haladaptatus halobius]|uniref:hypothetical protein n=1 Tax=Haladaptatus halobius TaxID=2884875 RepID=UPI001D0A9BFB|nr:hypothetical protein [Haladaptatus halobius]
MPDDSTDFTNLERSPVSLSETRRTVLKSIGVIGAGSVVGSNVSAEESISWVVTELDGTLEAVITQKRPGAPLTLTVLRDGAPSIESSPLGITTGSEDFTTGLAFLGRTDLKDNGEYQLSTESSLTGGKEQT